MEENYNKLGFLIVLCVLMALVIIVKKYIKEKQKQLAALAEQARQMQVNQTTDIWNISGRVNQEGTVTSEPQRWPTHDGHVSIDSYVMPENFQPHKKDRVPPPPYCEVDLPTYEEATAMHQPKNELVSVHVVPSCSRSGQTS